MFSSEAQSAILDLHRRAERSNDTYTLECIDRALDEVVRHPLNTNPAAFQVRSALAHAAAVIKNRRALAPTRPIDDPGVYPGYLEPGFTEVEMTRWLDDAPLSAKERAILRRLADDTNLATLATEHGLALPRMREAISRARRRAKACHAVAVAV